MSDIPFNPEGSQEELDSPRPPRTLARIEFSEKHHRLRQHLEPLGALQRRLEDKLGSASLEVHSTSVNTAAPFEFLTSSYRRGSPEFCINSSNGWKTALDRLRSIRRTSRHVPGLDVVESLPQKTDDDLEENTASTLSSVREDIKSLWEDNIVREVLTRRKVRLEDAPGLWVDLFQIPSQMILVMLMLVC